MPKTLAGAKPDLENDLKILLQKASYEAFMTANLPDSSNPEVAGFVTDTMMDAAQKFSDKFSEEAYQPMANAIYKFVKEIGILAKPAALMSPQGSVTGIINLNDFTII